MYLTLRDPALQQDRHERPRAGGGPRVGSTVLLLGMVSFFTDVSSEMVTSVLPVYLTVAVGLSPLGFGLVDGVQQGFSAFVRLGAGVLGDRLRRYKGIAATGYGLSALSRLLLVVAPTGAGAITGIVALDRTGKGIRTAPRDAMIALAAPEGRTGAAFGAHRALDSAGAALGPLLALTVLLVTVDDYRAVFVCSTGLAVVGLAVLGLVRDPSRDRPRRPPTSTPAWTVPLRDPALRRPDAAAGPPQAGRAACRSRRRTGRPSPTCPTTAHRRRWTTAAVLRRRRSARHPSRCRARPAAAASRPGP